MDGGAWWAAIHGVARSQTWLSDFTFAFHFHALEKEMATHSGVLGWRILGRGAWWAVVYGVIESWTWLKRLSSSSSRDLGKLREGGEVNATVCIYLNLMLNVKILSMYFFTFIYSIQLIVTPTGVCFGEGLIQNTGSLLLMFLSLSHQSLSPTLCDPMNCSTPNFPVLHYLLEFAQTYVHWVDDASNQLILCHLLLLLPSIFPSVSFPVSQLFS